MPTAVSAPGKVLLAGGYLVLDRGYTGLVFGLSARIHVVVEDLKTQKGVTIQEIVVKSPQFTGAEWIYGYHDADKAGGVLVTQLQGRSLNTPNKNPFVETTLAFVLSYIASLTSQLVSSSQVTILADNDYYSRPPSATSDPSSLFTNFNIPLSAAHKTGLGSSAALVTSLTASLLSHYLPADLFSLSSPAGQAQLHNLAQAAHCAAQGKIGSGFDVAAAVYGTCIYRRFSPSILSPLGELGSVGFGAKLKACVNDSESVWDTEYRKGGIQVPAGMQLLMCDVDCGSATPGMVKGVQAWRTRSPESSKKLWDELQVTNTHLADQLNNGNEDGIAKALLAIREKIREMGGASGVEIEPQAQTELLDALTGLEGVVGGVVPGAGGYDAVVLLVRDDEVSLRNIKEFLVKWSKSKGTNVKLLDVKGEMEGVRVEDGKTYGGWV